MEHEVPTLAVELLASFFGHRVGMSCDDQVREQKGGDYNAKLVI